MRNALLNKNSKHSDLRILFIDDNQLRYNQFIDLLAAKDYSAQAILLDDLISFEKYLKQRWDLVILQMLMILMWRRPLQWCSNRQSRAYRFYF